MHVTAAAEELLGRLEGLAGAEDVAEVRDAAIREATRLRHAVVVPGHVLGVLVRNAAEASLLAELGVGPATTPAQLLDRTRSEVDAAATAVPAATGHQSAETIVVARAAEASATCPACGESLQDNRRYETRRVPNPDGGRGSTMARVALCGSCAEPLGPG
jgi:hypothetical protein